MKLLWMSPIDALRVYIVSDIQYITLIHSRGDYVNNTGGMGDETNKG